MLATQAPIRSFGELARLALESENWPEDLALKPRSLSSLFSKLDREIELDWLLDRPEIQEILAQLFERPVADIRAVIGPSQLPGVPHLFRLHEARFARDLHLLNEELPPGLPSHWGNPYEWNALHLKQAPHRGLELLAAYLSARGRAQVVQFVDELHLSKLGKRGPLCLIHHGKGPLPPSLLQIDTSRRPVLLISQSVTPEGFQVDPAPALTDYLPALVDWFAARLDDSSHFKTERAEEWIKNELENSAPTWSEALSILGVFDELPARSIRGLSAPQLAQRFVQARLREHAARTSWGPNMLQHAWSRLLLALERGALNQLAASLEQWGQWLSKELTDEDAPAPDAEWMRKALKGALGKNVQQRDLARAARRLDPSGYQLARALLSAQLLRPITTESDEPDYQLNAAFLTRCLRQDYAREALTLDCQIWGDSLLSQQEPELIHELFERAERGDERFVAVLADSFNRQAAGCVAAFESVLAFYIPTRLQAHGSLENMLSHEAIESLCELLRLWSHNDQAHEPYFCLPNQSEGQREKLRFSTLGRSNEQLVHSNNSKSSTLMPSRSAVLTGAMILRALENKNFSEAMTEADAKAEPLSACIKQQIISTHYQKSTALAPLFELLKIVEMTPAKTFSWLCEEHPQLEAFLAFASTFKGQYGPEAQLWRLLTEEKLLNLSSNFISSPQARAFWESAPSDGLLTLMRQRLPIPYSLILPHQQLLLLRTALTEASLLSEQLVAALPEQALEIELVDALPGLLRVDGPDFTHALEALLQKKPRVLYQVLYRLENAPRSKLLKLIIKNKHFISSGEMLFELCAKSEKLSLWPPESLRALYAAVLLLCRAYCSHEAFQILQVIEQLLLPTVQKKSIKDFS